MEDRLNKTKPSPFMKAGISLKHALFALTIRTSSKHVELKKREGIKDNSNIIFLISQRKHML